MIFEIEKGHKYSNRILYKFFNYLNFNSFISYSVIFHESCRYDLPNKEDMLDVNKLFGYSIGFNPHINSVRFGWNYNTRNDNIDLFSYVYEGGIMNFEFIKSVNFNTKYDLSIDKEEDVFIFHVNDGVDVFGSKVSTNLKFEIGFSLWPYFGGTSLAPHRISLELI
jgi:hypothetical protein